MGNVAQFGKANGGIDEIAQYDIAGFHVTGKEVFDALSEKRFAEARITFYARPDCFLEVSCQSHVVTLLPLFVVCSLATGQARS